MFAKTLVQTFDDGFLMLSVCAANEREAWKVFERAKRAGKVPFYRYPDAGLAG